MLRVRVVRPPTQLCAALLLTDRTEGRLVGVLHDGAALLLERVGACLRNVARLLRILHVAHVVCVMNVVVAPVYLVGCVILILVLLVIGELKQLHFAHCWKHLRRHHFLR